MSSQHKNSKSIGLRGIGRETRTRNVRPRLASLRSALGMAIARTQHVHVILVGTKTTALLRFNVAPTLAPAMATASSLPKNQRRFPVHHTQQLFPVRHHFLGSCATPVSWSWAMTQQPRTHKGIVWFKTDTTGCLPVRLAMGLTMELEIRPLLSRRLC